MLALIAAAGFCGLSRGPVELAAFAAGLSQGQLRALRFRPDPHTRRHAAPSETVFTRVHAAVAKGRARCFCFVRAGSCG